MATQHLVDRNHTPLAPDFKATPAQAIGFTQRPDGTFDKHTIDVPRELNLQNPANFVPQGGEYSIFDAFQTRENGGFGDGAENYLDRPVTDWLLQTMDKGILQQIRAHAVWRDPETSARNAILERIGVRNKHLEKHSAYSLQLQRRFCMTRAEADAKASQIVNPQLAIEMQMIDSMYPSIGHLTNAYSHAKVNIV